jgi:hypothetical protein
MGGLFRHLAMHVRGVERKISSNNGIRSARYTYKRNNIYYECLGVGNSTVAV